MPGLDIREIVRAANDRWNTAFNGGDAGAVAALYTSDGTVLPPAHAAVKGTAAIADFWYRTARCQRWRGHRLFQRQVVGDRLGRRRKGVAL